MRRRVLEVELGRHDSLIRGYGSRELIISATGRPPVWSHVRRGWSCQEHTARDVIAAAELAGYDVVISGARSQNALAAAAGSSRSGADQDDPPSDGRADPGRGLW